MKFVSFIQQKKAIGKSDECASSVTFLIVFQYSFENLKAGSLLFSFEIVVKKLISEIVRSYTVVAGDAFFKFVAIII